METGRGHGESEIIDGMLKEEYQHDSAGKQTEGR